MALNVIVNNTGNAVPSDDYRDVQDNALIFDTFINNNSGEMVNDRLGVARHTLASAINRILADGATAVNTINSNGTAAINTFNANAQAALDLLDENTITQLAQRAEAAANRADVAADANENIVMSEAEARSIRNRNNDKYSASANIHFGLGATETSTRKNINEGLYTNETVSNVLNLGREGSSTSGTSKTSAPKLNVAGSTFELSRIAIATGDVLNQIELPEAEQGFRIFDSTGAARGVANTPTLNLRTENDPKYGDTATTDEEAKGRAFEGELMNGDFRNGLDNWGISSGVTGIVTGGALNLSSTGSGAATQGLPSITDMSITYTLTFQARLISGSEFRVDLDNVNGGGDGGGNASGGNQSHTDWRTYTFEFTRNAANTPALQFFVLNNAVAEFRLASIVSNNEDVVVRRKDQVIPEYYLEEVTDANVEIFPVNIQSQSATFGDTDVPTVPSTRPLTYFAQYEGQTDVVAGRCVRWNDLTLAQKRAVAEYLGENLFINAAGNLVNGRVRFRTLKGPGNGDWNNISTASGRLEFDANTPVRPQGILNTPSSSAAFDSDSNNQGIFLSSDNSTAYNGECFALPFCEVDRLNQGAYHPLNLLGSKTTNSSTSVAAGVDWNDSDALEPLTLSECFNVVNGTTDTTTRGGVIASGDISSAASGRPDSKYHDGITASGQGGVIDRRLSAWNSIEWWKESDRRMKRTKFRGLEGLPFTRVFNAVGDVPSGWIIVDQSVSNAVVAMTTLDTSVSSEFYLIEVLGAQSDVRDVAQLSQGWIGYWNPTNAVGGYTATLTRERLGTGDISCLFTTDDGSTWTERSLVFNSVPNTLVVDSVAGVAGSVVICDYEAYAYQTEQSSNMIPVDEIGKVWFSANHDIALGSPLVESFINKAPVSDSARPKWYATQSYVIGSDDELEVLDDVGHVTLDTTAPANSSRAVSALVYPVEVNGQVFLQYQINEKQHNGTNWGGETIELTETGADTYTDDNGNTGLRKGVFISSLPIGWALQRAEAGSESSPA